MLVNNEEMVDEYGKRAQERVKNIYSWDIIASEFKRIYLRILDK